MFSLHTREQLNAHLKTVPRIVVESSLKHDIDALVGAALPAKLAVVCDRATYDALGDQVVRALKGCIAIVLEDFPAADEVNVKRIQRESLACDGLVAVGSGTINDLCKYAAFLDGKPYGVFATAASMNGYLSANASITLHEHKKTLPAQMPQAVWCDLSVIAAAPPRLSKSGLGDSLARSTAQADWLLSHLLLNTPYESMPFELLVPLEEALFDSARGIAFSDRDSIRLLMETLLISGLGMTIAGGSYPASQGEHMIAHAYEMSAQFKTPKEDNAPLPPLHGEQIGVTTLVMAHRQEKLLRHHLHFDIPAFPAEKMTALFGPYVKEEALKAYNAKLAVIEGAGVTKEGLKARWPQIAERIEKIRIKPEKILAVLQAAKAPVTSEKLGWHAPTFVNACNYARFTRERFTFLDIA